MNSAIKTRVRNLPFRPMLLSTSLKMLGKLLRQILPLGLGVACLWLLSHRMGDMDFAAIRVAITQVSMLQWGAALLATGASFWAVGRYDTVMHRYLGTGLAPRITARAGVLSIALAQTLGLGVFTGAFARWRALPGIDLGLATRLSALVAVSFLAGWAVITALACLFLTTPVLNFGANHGANHGANLGVSALPLGWTALPLIGAIAITVAALLWPKIHIYRRNKPPFIISLPTLPAMGAILGLTFLDTLAAAVALLVLLPSDLNIGIVALYPIFLLALGAALISGTPGGVGPFELALFTLLPQHPEPALLAGIIGFRLVYYALPACLAALLLLRRQPAIPPFREPRPHAMPGPRLLAHARRAELGVARQNGGLLLTTRDATAITVETGQTLTALFDPARGDVTKLLPVLTAAARARTRVAVLYKCNARNAVHARAFGYKILHIANEAVINPMEFSLDGARFRQLRRKLRNVEKSGMMLQRATHLPVHDMAEIDRQWRARQGGARGFSMGTFCADYLSDHHVYLAWKDDKLQGFVSFHVCAHEMCLDLMRSADDAPDGMMHALIHCAITHGANHGRTRLSLASIPVETCETSMIETHVRRLVARISGGAGQAQFKASFSPIYEPLYMAAPTQTGLLLATADLAVAVRRAPSPSVDKLPIPPEISLHKSAI